MNSLFKKIALVLQLTGEVKSLDRLSSGWYLIKHTGDITSRRYNLAFTKKGFKTHVVIHDFKTGANSTFMWDERVNYEILTEITSDPKPVKAFDNCFESKKAFKDNGYFKKKKLLGFDIAAYKLANIDYQSHNNMIGVPYTNFAVYPSIIGVKLIGANGNKMALPGSLFKEGFHAHRYNPETTSYILGEGFPECCVAKHVITNFNILEVGSVNNMENIIKILCKNSSNIIYVMAEHGSEKIYDTLASKYPSLKVNYTPYKTEKDFGDYYIKAGLEKTKDAILGLLFEQSTLGYKPLGIEGTGAVFYSKVINDIVKLEPEHFFKVYRLVTKNPWDAHTVSKKTKEKAAAKLFMECAQYGAYLPDNVLPIGLWKYGRDYFYNDGTKVLKVNDNELLVLPYSDVIRSDFLLRKIPSKCPIEPFETFKGKNDLEKLFELCDWEEPINAKILLGFLVQSFYAGCLDFRPHLWIMSDTTHAGKSWIASWIFKNLIPNAFSRESGRSTTAGASQDMANLAGLMVCDEFAEKGTAYAKNAVQMIELLRSAATAQAPIVVGTPEQKPIKAYIKFSALLACIEGEDLLEQQDYGRIIFIRLGKKKGSFEKDRMPVFAKFLDMNKHKGFAAHCLKSFRYFLKIRPELLIRLTAKYPHIGHKARGMATVIAAYAAYYRDKSKIEPFLNEIETSGILRSYEIRAALKNEKEDLIERILRITIRERLVSTGDTSIQTVLQILTSKYNTNALKAYGIVMKKDIFLNIYCSEFNNFNEIYLKMSRAHLYKMLATSKYFKRVSNSYFNKKKSRYFQFDLSNYLEKNK